MKPALVLGLALAANAMAADSNNNELFVAPTGKLGDLRFPSKIMYDEVADDELALALAPRSVFKSDEEYKKYVYSMRNHWDDAADDELAMMILSRDRFKTEEEYKKYYNRARFTLDDADDELWGGIDGKGKWPPGQLRIPPGQWKLPSELKTRFTADDEELFFAPGQRIGNLAAPYSTLNFDEQADDELWFGITADGKGTFTLGRTPEEMRKWRIDRAQWKPTPEQKARIAAAHPNLKFDEIVDDELAVMIHPRSRFTSDEEYEKYKILMRRHFDDVADDELALKIVNFPAENVAFDDDELIFNPPAFLSTSPTDVYGRILRDSRGLPIQPLPARFDEVADDELGVKYVHLPVAETQAFDDDEFVAMLLPRSRFSTAEEYQKYVKANSRQRPSSFDDADDEFAINQQVVQLPVEHVAFDDDELMRGIPPVENFKSYEDWLRFTRKMSEEADDELVYLGQLLNERAQPRSFDEYRKKTEKPSHEKTKEKTQMKRKLRPVVDEVPLAQN